GLRRAAFGNQSPRSRPRLVGEHRRLRPNRSRRKSLLMSALPERKKSAEEIARMREQMGLPFVSPAPADSTAPEPVEPEPGPVSPPKPEHSLGRAEGDAAEEIGSPETSPSGLPVRRRSQRELDELRRRESLRAL